MIGTTLVVEAALDGSSTQPLDPHALRFDRDLNLLTWRIQGNVSNIDHFLVAKESSGIRTLIGKIHSEFAHGNCQFFHDLTQPERIFLFLRCILQTENTSHGF